jgi:hypothetical protein
MVEYNMKRQCSYLVALMLMVDSQVANGESPRIAQDQLRESSQPNEDLQEKKLRKLLESTDLTRVSYLFAKSKQVTISRGRSGQLRIFVGDVSDELLTTKINVVLFGPTERYNAIDAIIAITRTKEIQAKLGELGVEQPLTAYPGYRQIPDRRVPHLAASIKNVTMEEALDQVAETFDCLIIYAGWTVDGSRLFNVDCAEGADFEGLGRKRIK